MITKPVHFIPRNPLTVYSLETENTTSIIITGVFVLDSYFCEQLARMRMTTMTMDGVYGGSSREESGRMKPHHRMIISMRRPNVTVRRRARILLRKACNGVASATAAATALALAEPAVVPSMATALRRLLASRHARPSASLRWTCFNAASASSPPIPPSPARGAAHSALLVIHDLVARVPLFYRYIANGRFLRALWRLQLPDHQHYRHHHLEHDHHFNHCHTVDQDVLCSCNSSGRGQEFAWEGVRGCLGNCHFGGEDVGLSPKLLVAAWARDLSGLACTDVTMSRSTTIQQVDPAAVFWVEAYKRLARRFSFPQPPSRSFVCPVNFPISPYSTLPPSPPPSPPPQPQPQSAPCFHIAPFSAPTFSVPSSPPLSGGLSHSINTSSSYPHSSPSRRFYDQTLSTSLPQPTPSSSIESSTSSSSAYSSSSNPSFTTSAVASTSASSYRRPRRASLRNTAKFLAVLRRHNNVFGLSDPYYIAPPTSITAEASSQDSYIADTLSGIKSRSTTTVMVGGGGSGSVSVAAVARENARRRISETRSASASATSSIAPSSSLFTDSIATSLLPPQLAIEEDAYGCAVLDGFTGEVELKDDAAPPVTPCTFACLPVDGEGKKDLSSSSKSSPPPPLLPLVDAKVESHDTENWVSDSDFDHSEYGFECDYTGFKCASGLSVDEECNARNDDVAVGRDDGKNGCVLLEGMCFPDVNVVSDGVVKTHFTVDVDGYVKETRVVSLPLLYRATRPFSLVDSENFHPCSLHNVKKPVSPYSPWPTQGTHLATQN